MAFDGSKEQHLEIIKDPSTTSTVESFGDKLDGKPVIGEYTLGKMFHDNSVDKTPTKEFAVQPTYTVKSYQ